jgi:hypothetical protein
MTYLPLTQIGQCGEALMIVDGILLSGLRLIGTGMAQQGCLKSGESDQGSGTKRI